MASEGDTGPGGTPQEQLHTPLLPPPGSGSFCHVLWSLLEYWRLIDQFVQIFVYYVNDIYHVYLEMTNYALENKYRRALKVTN